MVYFQSIWTSRWDYISIFLNTFVLFIIEDSDGVRDDGEDGDEDEVGDEELADADEALTEAVEGEVEEEKERGGEEFVDKEHESQFCLETNFMGEGEQEDTESNAEHEDSKGKKGMNHFSSK